MSPPARAPRLGAAAIAVGAALAAGLAAMLIHARAGRAEADRPAARQARAAIVGLTGSPDLALSSASRWLRHPSLSEPGAAFADAPAMPDTDPAGAAIAAPRALFHGAARERLTVRRAHGAPR